MSKINNISLLFLTLFLFLMLSGCGIGRAFHGGYHHKHYDYGSFYDSYGQSNYGSQNYSIYNRGFFYGR